MEKLSFSISKYELSDISNSQLSKMTLYICCDGKNANGTTMTLDTIKKCASTLVKKPVIYAYSNLSKDFLEHEDKQFPCGFFSETENNIRYEEIDGKTWIIADALIWKFYCEEVIKTFRRDRKKSISMEIEIIEKKKLDDGYYEILSFAFAGVTLLGKKFQPAYKGANAQIVKFSQLIEQTENILHTYSSTSQVSLIDKNTVVESEDNEMTFNKTEFAQQFGMSANQIKDAMNELCSTIKYTNGDYEYSKYWVSDYTAQYALAYDYENNKCVAIPYSMDDGKINMDFENAKNAKSVQTWVIEGEDEDVPDSDIIDEILAKLLEKIKGETDDMVAKFEAKIESEKSFFESEKAEMSNKIAEKEDSLIKMGQQMDEMKETYATKDSEFEAIKTENETLKNDVARFSKEKKETEAEMVLSKYSKKINETERKELLDKLETFASVEDFEKEVKAFVCDKYEAETKGKTNFTTYSHMSINTNSEQKSEDNHWTSYAKDYINK